MSFCASCTNEFPLAELVQRPIGKNNGMTLLCRSCDEDPAYEKRGPELAYEPPCSKASQEKIRANATRVYAGIKKRRQAGMTSVKDMPHGWMLHRVMDTSSKGPVDQRAARRSFSDKPWASSAEYLGRASGYFLFAYPPHVELRGNGDPIVELGKYRRTKPKTRRAGAG